MKIFKICVTAIAVLLAALYFGVWLLSPLLVRQVGNGVLQQFNLQLDKGSSVRLNPFLSRIHIEKLKLQSDTNEYYALNTLQVEYSLWALLLANEVKVQVLRIKGMRLVVEKQDESLKVAGFDLPNSEEPEPNPEPPSPSEPSKALSVYVPNIDIQDVLIDVTNQGHRHQLSIQKLRVQQLQFVDNALSAELALHATLDGASIVLDCQVQASADSSDLGLRLKSEGFTPETLAYLLPENIQHLAGELSLELQTTVKHRAKDIKVLSKLSRIGVKNLAYTDDIVQLNLDETQFSASDLNLAYNMDTHQYDFKTAVNLVLSQFNTMAVAGNDRLLQFGQLDLGKVVISAKPDTYQVNTNQVKLENIVLSEVQQQGLPPLVINKALTVSEIAITPEVISIDNVDLASGEMHIKLEKDSGLATLVDTESLSAQAETAETEEPKVAETEATAMPAEQAIESDATATPNFSLASITLSGPVNIHIEDNSKDFLFKKTYVLDALQVEQFDMAKPEQKTQFSLKLKDEAYFIAEAAGWAQPLLPKMNLELKAESKEFPMQDVAPYLRDSLGFEVEAGLLDMDLQASVQQNTMEGKTNLLMRGAQFKSSQKVNDEANLIGQTAIPLNVALNMLRDGKGNIKLKIPLNGSLDDPKFGLRHVVGLVIKKVAMQQAKSHLMTTFVPYAKVVSLAITAGEQALKVRFEDLNYAPQQLEPGPEQEDFIKQFTLLMSEKEKLSLRVCPIATPEDIQLAPGSKLNEQQHQQLLSIAKQRGESFKSTVVERGGIASSRILLCSEKVDLDKKAQPRIDFKT